MAEYPIVKELKSEIRIFSKITFSDLVIVLLFLLLGLGTQEMVSPQLSGIYVFFNVIVGVFCVLRSPTNKDKKVIVSMLLALIRNKNKYYGFEMPKVKEVKATKEAIETENMLLEYVRSESGNARE
ncbi:MAG: DUF5592 family protein [Acutalibacteraceae bacterium]|nr:DUF5592 family protein [Acutalibacteraceae bacterium]